MCSMPPNMDTKPQLTVLFIYNPDAEDETRETFQGQIDLPEPKALEGIRVSYLA